MDLMTIIGVFLAFTALILGSILKGAGVKGLLGGAAFVIVIVGTAAAVMAQTPKPVILRAMKMGKWLFKPPVIDPDAQIASVVEWSRIARKDGLMGLEARIDEVQDPFVRKGLQLLVDGGEPENIRHILEIEVETAEEFDTAGAKVFEAMGIYAPTLGIVGAVLGLMAVMANLADPSKLGTGIAAAFTATIYGIASANLFFLPFGNKLKYHVKEQAKMRTMMIEGLVLIAQGDNPRNIETRLQGYFVAHPKPEAKTKGNE
ncbi:MAG: flagellar motor protein [Pseudomonadota bacterium]